MIALRRSAYPLAWLAIAGVLGVWIAAQPAGGTGAAIALAALIVAALITPLAALVLLLVIAPLRSLIAAEAPLNLPLDVGQIALIALIGFWLFDSLTRRRALPRLRWSPVYLPVIGFFAAASLSIFSALSVGAWLNEWLKWVQILLLMALCLDLARRGSAEWVVFGLTLAGAANALIGIYQFFGGSGALHLLINERFFRAFGTFGQPNPFGGFMGLIAPLALMAALAQTLRLWRDRRGGRANARSVVPVIFYGGAAALIAAGVFVSWSRGAWLGFVSALAVMTLALPRRLWHGLLLIGVVGALVALLWSTGRLPASIVDRLTSFTQETLSFSDVRGVDITPENYALIERLAHWQAALNMATAHPWLGVGFGNYEAAYAQHSLMNWEMALGHAHNYYLNVLAETGIIGLVTYLAMWVSMFALTWRARQHPDLLARLTAVGLLGTWTYLSIHSLTDNLYVNNVFLHLGVMFGLLAVLYEQTWGTTKCMRNA